MTIATEVKELREMLRNLERAMFEAKTEQAVLQAEYNNIKQKLDEINDAVHSYQKEIRVTAVGLLFSTVSMFVGLFLTGKIVIG